MEYNIDIGILYVSLHNLIRKKAGMSKIISRKDFYCIIGKHFLVPKQIRVCIIKEMEERGLIKQLDKNTLQIIELDINIEEDANTFYKKLGLF